MKDWVFGGIIAGMIITAILLVALVAYKDPPATWATNQELRQRLFKECLQLVPKGPMVVHHNDWAEVIDECEDAAYYQARYCAKNCD